MDALTTLFVGGVVIAPIITGIVQLAKSYGMDSKYAQGLAVLIGLVIGILAKASGQTDGSWLFYVIVGIKAGFEAIGWHQVGTKTVEMVNSSNSDDSNNGIID